MKLGGRLDKIGGKLAKVAMNEYHTAGERRMKRQTSSPAAMNRQAVKELLGWYDRALESDCGLTAAQLAVWLVMRLYDRFLQEIGLNRLLRTTAYAVNAELPEPDADLSDELTAILNAYPFTAQEGESAGKGAALDPSLLGTLFENLLDSGILSGGPGQAANRTIRARTGAYYTNRTVVDYMVERCLIAYLHRRLTDKFGECPRREAYLRQLLAGGEDQPFQDEDEIQEIVQSLAVCKVLDPACGTGAFLIGVLQKMTHALRKLDPQLSRWRQWQFRKMEQQADTEERSKTMRQLEVVFDRLSPDAAFQLTLLQNNLYGIDIQPMALMICRLRLQLSLLSHDRLNAADDIFDPFTIPLIAANSLTVPDVPGLFGLSDRFEIVIGNPPYLGERKNKDAFRVVQSGPNGKYYLGRMDYFYFFFHLAIDILKDAGIGGFITTNYYPTALGARKLREDLKKRTTLLELVDFHEMQLFDGAAGQHNLITIFRSGRQDSDVQRVRVKRMRHSGVVTEQVLQQLLQPEDGDLHVVDADLWDGDEHYLRLSGVSGDGSGIHRALELLKQAATDDLGNICRPLIGLESSLDEVYVASKAFWLGIVDEITEFDYIKPFFKNSDIAKYKVAEHTDRYILYLHEQVPDIQALPGIYRYLQNHRERIERRKGANLRGAFRRGNWWVLNTPRLDMDFEDLKIVTPYRTLTPRFALTREPWYASRDVYYIIGHKRGVSLYYILALLNASLYAQWLYHRGKRKGEMLEIYAKPLKEIPIKEIDPREQAPFIALAQLAAHAAAHDPGKLQVMEDVIDALVYDLVFGEHMRARSIDTTMWITADLQEELAAQGLAAHAFTDSAGSDPVIERAPRKVRQAILDRLHRRWTDPAHEVRRRINRFADASPDLLAVITAINRTGAMNRERSGFE